MKHTALLPLAALVALPLLSGQAEAQTNWNPEFRLNDPEPMITVPFDPGDPKYRPGPRPSDTRFDGVIRLSLSRTDGNFACTGSLLAGGGGFHILTAAHCLGRNGNFTNSVTASFRNPATGAVEHTRTATGANVFVKPGYTEATVDERDVAIIRLSSAAPTEARGYSIFSGASVLDQPTIFAGYGLTGTGTTGATGSLPSFMRWGRNAFESTCRTGSSSANNCAGLLGSNPSADRAGFGGVLMSDFDDPTGIFNNNSSIACARYGVCNGAIDDMEVSIGGGDSGGASFFEDGMFITGVASFSTRTGSPPFGSFGTGAGFACVANVSTNAVCRENFQWVNSFVAAVPEPSSLALLGMGLTGLLGVARRRRA